MKRGMGKMPPRRNASLALEVVIWAKAVCVRVAAAESSWARVLRGYQLVPSSLISMAQLRVGVVPVTVPPRRERVTLLNPVASRAFDWKLAV